MGRLSLSIVIPTYGRDSVLCDTIDSLLTLEEPADEILIIDQTLVHSPQTVQRLTVWSSSGAIRWVQREKPSITEAMNIGLQLATGALVLFLDDDIVPSKELISEHRRAHAENRVLWATVGQVIQPWQQPADLAPPRALTGLRQDFDFPFHSTGTYDVTNVMAGNLCVRRDRALSISGFDTNFQGSAFRFETEFARRVLAAGGTIRFLGKASIHHLRVPSGGTRKDGSHLTSASPVHGIGDYYYAFLHGRPFESWGYSLRRVIREVCTKFHAAHPWWIPAKLTGEIRALWGGLNTAIVKKRTTRRGTHGRE